MNFLDLATLTTVTSAAFLMIYLSVYVAHWRLINETKANEWLVAGGFITMAAVLAGFVWNMARTQPWSVALIALVVAGSWGVERLLMQKGPRPASGAADVGHRKQPARPASGAP